MGFIKKIKDIWMLSQRIGLLETEVSEIDKRLESAVNQYSKQFEKKIQDMTFAYTRNLDDTKSDYLKRYLEQRMDGMQYDLKRIPLQLNEMRDNFYYKIEMLEKKED